MNPITTAKPGHRICKCGSCGEVFAGLSQFDRHRIGKHENGKVCTDPATANLKIKQTPTGSYWVGQG